MPLCHLFLWCSIPFIFSFLLKGSLLLCFLENFPSMKRRKDRPFNLWTQRSTLNSKEGELNAAHQLTTFIGDPVRQVFPSPKDKYFLQVIMVRKTFRYIQLMHSMVGQFHLLKTLPETLGSLEQRILSVIRKWSSTGTKKWDGYQQRPTECPWLIAQLPSGEELAVFSPLDLACPMFLNLLLSLDAQYMTMQ